MQPRARPSKPKWVAWLVASVSLLLIFAGYVAVTHAAVGREVPVGQAAMGRRDALYFSIHLATILLSSVIGFVLGKWLNGQGAAFALLFFVVMVSSLTTTQVVSYKLACGGGRNEIVRHWTC